MTVGAVAVSTDTDLVGQSKPFPGHGLLVVLCPADGVLPAKAWESVKPVVGAGVSDIDHEDGMPAAVGEEFGVDAALAHGGVEQSHVQGLDFKEMIGGLGGNHRTGDL